MSMIDKLEKISMQIFKNALKTYRLKDLLIHKRAHASNVLEMLSLFPNKGVGMHVRRKTLHSAYHYQVTRTRYKSLRFGNIYGLLYKNGVRESAIPTNLSGTSKRGVWEISLGNFNGYVHDNSVKYTKADYQAFLAIRGIGQQKERPLQVYDEAATENSEEVPTEEDEEQQGK